MECLIFQNYIFFGCVALYQNVFKITRYVVCGFGGFFSYHRAFCYAVWMDLHGFSIFRPAAVP